MQIHQGRCNVIMDKNFKMSRHVAGQGGSGGQDPSEILKVTFVNRVNPWTFCVEVRWGRWSRDKGCLVSRSFGKK